MFPQIELNVQEELQKEEQERGRNTFLVDFQKGVFLKQNGRHIKTDDNRSVRMFIEKVLLTRKFKYKVYKDNGETQYGVSFYDLIGGSRFPTGFLYAELHREITETLLEDERIESIEEFKARLERKRLHISFHVTLKNNSRFEWEGYIDG